MCRLRLDLSLHHLVDSGDGAVCVLSRNCSKLFIVENSRFISNDGTGQVAADTLDHKAAHFLQNVRSVNSLTEMIEKMGEDWDTRAVADSGMADYDRVGGIDMAEGSGETIPLVMPSSPPSLTIHPLEPFTTGFGSPVPIQLVGGIHVVVSSVTGLQAPGILGVGQLKLEGPAPFKGPGNRPGATKWLKKWLHG